jgi:hypothetical protein
MRTHRHGWNILICLLSIAVFGCEDQVSREMVSTKRSNLSMPKGAITFYMGIPDPLCDS